MKSESLPLSFLAKGFLIAFVALVVGNLLSFWVIYADTFTPFALPYAENFDQPLRLRYRQFGGFWRVQDAALIQNDINGTDLFAVIPLTLSAAQPYHFETTMQIVKGPNGGGLLFNLQNAKSRQQSHLVRLGSDQGNNYLVFGYFDEALNFVPQGSITPPDLAQSVRLAVDVHEETYDVLVNDQPVQRAIPLQYKGGRVALTTWFSEVRFDDIAIYAIDPQFAQSVQQTAAVEQPAPATQNTPTAPADPQPAAQTFNQGGEAPPNNVESTTPAEVVLADNPAVANSITTTIDTVAMGIWQPFAGQWAYENGKLVQTQTEGFDFGLSRGDKMAEGELSVRLRHRQGVGGGLLFGLPTQSSHNGGHMVRFFEDNAIAWGYFDENGNFSGQGYAPVASPGDQPHTLKVVIKEGSYSIVLDDQLLVEGVPLKSQEGFVGLTASNSVVEFDEMKIIPQGKEQEGQ